MKNKFKISNYEIDEFSQPFFIAEIGVNHEGSLEKAFKLIDLAKKGGASAVKFQTYKAEKIASKNSPAYWDTKKEKTKNQFQLFKKYDHFNKEEFYKLSQYSKKNRIFFSSTPFDHESVDFLAKFVDFFKIASADINNFPLIEKICKKNKPIIFSTGASNLDEVKETYNFIKKRLKNKNICPMHCILNYPTKDENANLNMIKSLKQHFPNSIIGYSDHTLPGKLENLVTSYLLGAVIIEKHFTYDKKLKGNDHYHSLNQKDLRIFFKKIDSLKIVLGNNKEKKILQSELISRKNARRSIYTTGKLKKNHIIKREDLICKRPGNGLAPKYIGTLLGKKIIKDLNEDIQIKWNHIK